MKYKDLFIGVLIGLVIAFGLYFAFGKSSISLGGSTSDDWNVGGELTVSGTGESAFAGNLVADGGFVVGGNVDVGETASFSITAAQACDENWLTANPNGLFDAGADAQGASVSLPTEEALTGDCLSSEGDITELWVDNTATAGGRFLDFLTPGSRAIKYATRSSDFDTGDTMLIRFTNYDGTSVSYYIDTFMGVASATN